MGKIKVGSLKAKLMMQEKKFDVIAMGRSGVDIYAEQVGSRLEDVRSFAKYLGGSPTNTMTCAARLGLKTGLITRVGNEHMGRFIRESLEKENVDTTFVITDETRLTNLVMLGLKDKKTFPLIFFRENCADMNLSESDVDENYIIQSKAVLLSGTHLSTEKTALASEKMAKISRKHNIKVALDIDYRPVLWGLTSKGEGENRFVQSTAVSKHLQKYLPLCDLIVGTEEEIHIAGGSTNTINSLKEIRKITDAILVVKLGSSGCVVIEDEIPQTFNDTKIYSGFKVDVFNVLGAGDGFMGGLLFGWLKGHNWDEILTYANACGALAVSRHGCTPAYPSFDELEYFIKYAPLLNFELRKDKNLNQIHWSTATRKGKIKEVLAFAFDHRIQLQDIAKEFSASKERIAKFKEICFEVVSKAKEEYPNRNLGFFCDNRFGLDVLNEATGKDFWIAQPIEYPKVFPLEFEGKDSLVHLKEVPNEHCIKCLFTHHPNDSDEIKKHEIKKLKDLFEVCRELNLELLLEAIPNKKYETKTQDLLKVIESIYENEIYPDFWKLECQSSKSNWSLVENLIKQKDPYCRGILLLGLSAPIEEILDSIKIANEIPMIKGFAIGRTIFSEVAKDWFSRNCNDELAISKMLSIYKQFIQAWKVD